MAAAVCERREMFLTNHALVMAAIAGDPQLRVREIAQLVGVTERAVESIVRDLTNAGYLTRMRRGRRNHYRVHLERTFQHPMVARLTLGRLVAALVPNPGVSEKEPAGEPVTGAVIPESSISCAHTGESLILSATGQQGAQEGNVKRILIYGGRVGCCAFERRRGVRAQAPFRQPRPPRNSRGGSARPRRDRPTGCRDAEDRGSPRRLK
jgi:DNA-binding transcriptional ArsR family regulator